MAGEEGEKSLANARLDLLTLAADLDLLPFVPRVEEVVGLVEEHVLAGNPLDWEAT